MRGSAMPAAVALPCEDLPAKFVARLAADLIPGLVLRDCNELQQLGLCVVRRAQRHCPAACGSCPDQPPVVPSHTATPCVSGTATLLAAAHAYVELRGESWFGLNTSEVWRDSQLGTPLSNLASSALALWQAGGTCAAEWYPVQAATIDPGGRGHAASATTAAAFECGQPVADASSPVKEMQPWRWQPTADAA